MNTKHNVVCNDNEEACDRFIRFLSYPIGGISSKRGTPSSGKGYTALFT